MFIMIIIWIMLPVEDFPMDFRGGFLSFLLASCTRTHTLSLFKTRFVCGAISFVAMKMAFKTYTFD